MLLFFVQKPCLFCFFCLSEREKKNMDLLKMDVDEFKLFYFLTRIITLVCPICVCRSFRANLDKHFCLLKQFNNIQVHINMKIRNTMGKKITQDCYVFTPRTSGEKEISQTCSLIAKDKQLPVQTVQSNMSMLSPLLSSHMYEKVTFFLSCDRKFHMNLTSF